MNNYRISDHAASGLVAGRVPLEHPELASLAVRLAEYRHVALEQSASPQPSAALAALLDGTVGATVRASGARTARPKSSRLGSAPRGRVVGGFLGLGLGAQVILGVALGAAATTGGLAAAGASHVLPSGAQDVFDSVVSTVAGTVAPASNDPAVGPGVVPGISPTETPAPGASFVDDSDGSDGSGESGSSESEGSSNHDPAGKNDTTSGNSSSNSSSNSSNGKSGDGNSGTGNSGNGNGNSGSDHSGSNNGKPDGEKSGNGKKSDD